MTSIQIAGRPIGDEHPVYVVAELSGNHNHDYDRAVALVHAAKDAGADAVKLQTYTPDTITLDADTEYFRLNSGTMWDGRRLHELYGEAYTPWEWQPKLKALAQEFGMHCFSSPFDETSVDFLEEMAVPAYKIASFELVDLPLIRKAAATKKPMILSTGMASLAEIDEAVRTARDAGCTELILLKTNSAYPAPPSEMNLRTIQHLGEAFGVPVGLSDHTLGTAVAVASVALGARFIEKHLCLSRNEPGPDTAFSLEPHEFKEMVDSVRVAQEALGSVSYAVTKKQRASRVFRRSLFISEDVRAGEELTAANVRDVRPGHGLHTRYLGEVLGRRAARDTKKGTPLSWDLLA